VVADAVDVEDSATVAELVGVGLAEVVDHFFASGELDGRLDDGHSCGRRDT
jgi:hypothetical protein